MKLPELVVVELRAMDVYYYCVSATEALDKLRLAQEHTAEDIERWRANCAMYPENSNFAKWLAQAERKQYAVMTLDTFQQLQREKLLSDPLVEVTQEQLDEALNILPPRKWCTIHNVEMFCMREMYTESYTTQYAKNLVTGKCYCKMVDLLDKSTWIHAILEQLPPEEVTP